MKCLRGLPRLRIYHDKHCSGDMRYACDVCGERFFVHGHMKRHLYSHTGIKPHACRSLRTLRTFFNNKKKIILIANYNRWKCGAIFASYGGRMKHERAQVS